MANFVIPDFIIFPQQIESVRFLSGGEYPQASPADSQNPLNGIRRSLQEGPLRFAVPATSTVADPWVYPAVMTNHDHDHHGDHDHSELSEMELRVRALETVLSEKGYIDPAALDAIVQAYETRIGPHNGAQVVAKAWSDPAFKLALLEDATKAVGTLGHVSRVGDHLVAVENTPGRHNMVVCTLCSCYPWEMLGLPPVWYKAAPYRSRAVKDPRGVLADFGVSVPKDTEIRVWDSTAETRFLVLPMRPAGTEGWSEAQLAEIVTRDSMIGTGFPKTPGAPS
jgi:nitrile hydratase subunit alpha